MRTVFIVLGVVCPLVGCSGSNDSGLAGSGGAGSGGGAAFEPMFGPPGRTQATPNSLYGLWGVAEERAGVKYDIRMRIAEGRVTMAGRCGWHDGTSLTVGTSGSARVAPKEDKFGCFAPKFNQKNPACGSIALLESKNERETRGEKYCAVEMKPITYEYSLAETDLRLMAGAEMLNFVKISD